ncbi:MAG TPA: Rrf2 family transcriptional regulator [Candidatus Kapabacteria bacterium]|jgi:Rrf2 family protein|nr:Rrf2 family transcriptional regulator [Candidatus Kapabacteria bacterium]
MILSKSTGYGIRALAFLARRTDGRPSLVHEIAEHEGIPPVFLQKILGELRRHRMLRSAKGIHGGYELERPAEEITLWEIFSLLEPDPHLDTCILGRGICRPENACGLHADWQRIRHDLVGVLQQTTLAHFAGTPALAALTPFLEDPKP